MKARRIYLNDHLMSATGAVELAGRAQGTMSDGPAGPWLAAAHRELTAERDLLLEAMGRLGVRRDRVKEGAGWLGEKVGRLKLNGSLRQRSPVSDVVELEGLLLLGEHNLAVLRTLRELAVQESALQALELETAIERAVARRDTLEEQRAAAAVRALNAR
ncbi:MAG TPA: hypothetical protein VGW11_05200 [Solirubrobacteraceae bacterium]|nr:hypothetical protein [Solirubrobacteraceae bacterium]